MVEIRNLSKSFDKRLILDNFSYTFAETGLYALIGESGRGKTTLLRIIAHLEDFEKGSLKSPKRIAYAFQEYRLFNQLSVYSNIESVSFRTKNEKNRELISYYLERLGLSDAAHLFPSELSGGMRQRVSLIRAFVCDTPVVLLDEPFKELDQTLAQEIVEIIRELSKTKLVIFTAHDEQTAKNIDAECIIL